jgi:hypothetical protein
LLAQDTRGGIFSQGFEEERSSLPYIFVSYHDSFLVLPRFLPKINDIHIVVVESILPKFPFPYLKIP